MTSHAPPAGTFPSLTVLDALQLRLIECEPDAALATVARKMAECRIHCVIVTGIRHRGRDGEPLSWGIVSDLDLMAGVRPGLSSATAADLAATGVVIVEPGDSLEYAAQLMAEHETSHVVAVSRLSPSASVGASGGTSRQLRDNYGCSDAAKRRVRTLRRGPLSAHRPQACSHDKPEERLQRARPGGRGLLPDARQLTPVEDRCRSPARYPQPSDL